MRIIPQKRTHLRRCPGLVRVICLVAAAKCSAFVLANGWEHTAIPLQALTLALDNPRAEIRQRAAESLGHRHEPAATAALIERLAAGESSDRSLADPACEWAEAPR